MGMRYYLVFIFRSSLKNYRLGICCGFLSNPIKSLRTFYHLL
jgi:hypothetical protein